MESYSSVTKVNYKQYWAQMWVLRHTARKTNGDRCLLWGGPSLYQLLSQLGTIHRCTLPLKLWCYILSSNLCCGCLATVYFFLTNIHSALWFWLVYKKEVIVESSIRQTRSFISRSCCGAPVTEWLKSNLFLKSASLFPIRSAYGKSISLYASQWSIG